MSFNMKKAGEKLKISAGVAGDKMRILSQTMKEKTSNVPVSDTINPEIVQLHNSIRTTNQNLKIMQKASKQAAASFEDFKRAEMSIASALGTLGTTESAPLSNLCSDLSAVISRLSGLLDMKAKDMSRVEIPITQFQTTQIKTAKDMKNRYDKLRIQVEATNKQRVVEANLDQAFQHMTESTVYKLREVEARKQFEIADVCCDMVTDHINFLSRSLTILKELEPKLQQAKAESQQRRKEFEDKFKGPPVSEPALTISTADRQSLGLPPLLRSGDKPRHVVRNSAPAPERTKVFGTELSALLKRSPNSRSSIPPFVDKAISYLEAKGLGEEGLFRISGNKATMEDLQLKIDCGMDYNLEEEVNDPHCVAGLLKQYVRVLPGGLICGKAQQRFVAAASLREESLMADYLAVMLPASLPRENYDLLKSLFLHFHKVVQHKDITKMTEANMATVWGPNLFLTDDPMSMQAGNLPEIVKVLIKNAPMILADENLARASDTYEGKAGYDLQPRSAVELELRTGDSLFVWRTFSPEWVYAENQGVVGLVPLNYITL